jgi:hypothetical protein
MKTPEDIRKIAEELIPYNPYNNTLFPGIRESEISGFIKGYMEAQKNFLNNIDQKGENSEMR